MLFGISSTSNFLSYAALVKKMGFASPKKGSGLDEDAQALLELIIGGLVAAFHD